MSLDVHQRKRRRMLSFQYSNASGSWAYRHMAPRSVINKYIQLCAFKLYLRKCLVGILYCNSSEAELPQSTIVSAESDAVSSLPEPESNEP